MVKDYVVFLGSVLIFVLIIGWVVFWMDDNLDVQKNIKSCNDHWVRQVADTCPAILKKDSYDFIINTTKTNS